MNTIICYLRSDKRAYLVIIVDNFVSCAYKHML